MPQLDADNAEPTFDEKEGQDEYTEMHMPVWHGEPRPLNVTLGTPVQSASHSWGDKGAQRFYQILFFYQKESP